MTHDTKTETKNVPLDRVFIDTPDDNNCLFWSAALGLLLPHLDNETEFNQKYAQLFGEGPLSLDNHELILIEDPAIREGVRNMLRTYDCQKETPLKFQGRILQTLVCTVFRGRVVTQLDKVFPTGAARSPILVTAEIDNPKISNWEQYTNAMRDPSAWGGDPEIRAIGHLAQVNICVASENAEDIPYPFSDNQPTLYLKHVNNTNKADGQKTHYHYGLSLHVYTKLSSDTRSASLNAPAKASVQQPAKAEKKEDQQALAMFKDLEQRYGTPKAIEKLAKAGLDSLSLGHKQQAKSSMELTLRILKKQLSEEMYNSLLEQRVLLLSNLTKVCIDLQEWSAAKTHVKEILPLLENRCGKDSVPVAKSLLSLAEVCWNLNEWGQAKTSYERALSLLEKSGEKDEHAILVPLGNLAMIYIELKEMQKAKETIERVLPLLKKHYGENNQVAIYLAKHLELMSPKLPANSAPTSAGDTKNMPSTQAAKPKVEEKKKPQQPKQAQSSSAIIHKLKQPEAPLEMLCQPLVLELLQQNNEETVAMIFENEGFDFNNSTLHQQLAQKHLQRENLPGFICHTEIALRLMPKNQPKGQLSAIYQDLACIYHVYANQQRKANEHSAATATLAQAEKCFKEGIALESNSRIHTEYANFLLRQQRPEEAIGQLERAIQHDDSADDLGLKFTPRERSTLDKDLQLELVEWEEIEDLKTTILAHYLLVKAHLQIKAANPAADTALAAFQKQVMLANDPIFFSLLGHIYRDCGDYHAASLCYQQAIKSNPNYQLARQQMASCAAHIKEGGAHKSEAAVSLEQALATLSKAKESKSTPQVPVDNSNRFLSTTGDKKDSPRGSEEETDELALAIELSMKEMGKNS